MKKISFLIMLFAASIYTSCSDDNYSGGDLAIENRSVGLTDSESIEYRNRFAQVLSIAIQNEDVKNWLIDRCDEKQNLERDVLYFSIKDLVFDSKSTRDFKSLLIEIDENQNFSKTLPVSTQEFYTNYFMEFDPLLTIYFQIENGGSGTFGYPVETPSVYVGKLRSDDHIIGEPITSYNLGNETIEPYGDEPIVAYFAIKTNDRILVYNDISEEVNNTESTLDDLNVTYIIKEFVTSNDAFIGSNLGYTFAYKRGNYKPLVVGGGGPSGGTGTGGDGGSTTRDGECDCSEDHDRDCYDGKDAITRLIFTHDYEGWPNGGPEFIVNWWFGVTEEPQEWDQSVELFIGTHNDYCFPGHENTWYTKNNENGFDLIESQFKRWDFDENGMEMFQHWVEDDHHIEIKFKVGLKLGIGGSAASSSPITSGISGTASSGTSFDVSSEWNFETGDDEIGGIYVEYTDDWCENWPDWGYPYIVGQVKFHQLDRGW